MDKTKEVIKELHEKKGNIECKNCGIYSKNGELCRKCYNEKYPVEEGHFRYEYYKMNVVQYARKFDLPIVAASLEINRQIHDSHDEFYLKWVEREKRRIKLTSFAFGAVSFAMLNLLLNMLIL